MKYSEKIGDHLEKYIRWFSELSKEDYNLVGNKAANLSEIYNANFPVPKGFVITTEAFDYFLKINGLKEKIISIIETIDIDNIEELNKRSDEIRNLIENFELPNDLKEEIIEAYRILSSEKIDTLGVSQNALTILKNSEEPIFVSVRSSVNIEDSSNYSFAGQYDNFLYIKGERSLLEHVIKCFSSSYTPRAIYYRNKRGYSEDNFRMGVIVMKMIDSQKSGVIFSKNPIVNNENIIIEAIYGSGLGLVSGRIKPDEYIVSKNLKINEINISDKKIAVVRSGSGNLSLARLVPERSKSQVLSNGQIIELTNYAIRIEELFDNTPQDIEFSIETNKVFILQSRPITKVYKEDESKKTEISGKILLEGTPASPGIAKGDVKIIKNSIDILKIKKGDVIVTDFISPEIVIALNNAIGIVSTAGGITSNTSIITRELGIPCIVGAEEATSVLKEEMKISIDCYRGRIYEGEIVETEIRNLKPIFKTNRVKLRLVIENPSLAEIGQQTGIDTIGILKIEGIIAESGKHPLFYEKENKLDEYSEIIRKGIEKASKYFNTIWVRTSDIRSDEYSSLIGAPEKERNPLLGIHGIRFSLKHEKIFKSELNAVKKIAEKNPNKNFGVLFPQITLIEELKKAKEIFNDFKLENLDYGMIVETPSSVHLIENFISEGVKLIVIDTDDLIQYTLAIDKNYEDIKHLYQEIPQPLISQIKRIISACRRNKIELGILGESVKKSELISILFKDGINYIYVNPEDSLEISKTLFDLEEKRNQDILNKKSESRLNIPQNNFKNQKRFEEIRPLQNQGYLKIIRPFYNEKIKKVFQKTKEIEKSKPYQTTKFKPIESLEYDVTSKTDINLLDENNDKNIEKIKKDKDAESKRNDEENLMNDEEDLINAEAIIKDYEEDEMPGEKEEKYVEIIPEKKDKENLMEKTKNQENKDYKEEKESKTSENKDILDLTKKNHYAYFDEDYK
ncbi:MAG: PEP/pyruvate-binding domain-containing protein [Candidatus Pacearchaeota archaeon]